MASESTYLESHGAVDYVSSEVNGPLLLECVVEVASVARWRSLDIGDTAPTENDVKSSP